MKRMKIYFLLFAVLITLSACMQQEPPAPSQTEPDSSSPITARPSASLNSPEETSAQEDAPVQGMVHSRLTNEWTDPKAADTRPIAVIIPNESSALPHYSLSKASVLYEANVEGCMTRLMAIYEDWQTLQKIGNIRSLRAYYTYWAFEWDAFLVYLGGPFFINDLMAEPNTQGIDGILSSDSEAFFRSSDRSSPHNAYTSGSGLSRVIEKKGYSLGYRGLSDGEHFHFADKNTPNTLEQYGENAQNAIYIDMSGCYPLTRCYFEYNEDDGLYYRSQHLSGDTDGPHIDAATGEQLSFRNVLVQYVKYQELGEGYLAFQCHDTTMDGWFFTNGKGIHVNWKKESDYSATRYYDDNGSEILMNTGKTMICIVEEGDKFSFR